jgi:hypothetical protein
MTLFVEPLERRVLMSATKVTLASDVAAIVADVQSTRVTFQSLRSVVVSGERAIGSALRGLANLGQNSTLLRRAELDASRLFSITLVSASGLVTVGTLRSRHAAEDGDILLAHPTNAFLKNHVAGHVQALETQIPSLSQALETRVAAALQKWDSDLSELLLVNADNAGVASAVQTAENDATAQVGRFTAAAAQFEADIVKLGNDLLSIGN